MQADLGLMFERKATEISYNGGRSVTMNLRARQDCIGTSRKTDFRQKNETSACLKITFVDMTYPGQRPELPSLSRHFLLAQRNVYCKRCKSRYDFSHERTILHICRWEVNNYQMTFVFSSAVTDEIRRVSSL